MANMIGGATITNCDFGIRNGSDNNFFLVTGAGSTFNNVSGRPFSIGGQYINFTPIDALASGNHLDAVPPVEQTTLDCIAAVALVRII